LVLHLHSKLSWCCATLRRPCNNSSGTLAVWALASNSRELAGGLGFKGSFLLFFQKSSASRKSGSGGAHALATAKAVSKQAT
jgi:hypothetical protein